MHRDAPRRAIAITILVALGMLALGPGVLADQAYHTEKLAFEPVGNAPLRDGFVVNIHPNGPKVYAHEIYTLKGAEKNTTYQVYLTAFVENPECTPVTPESTFTLPMAELTTNAAGNGKASAKFTPENVEGLRDMTHGVLWTVELDGQTVYTTACTAVALD
jgi:hypothetical protein